MPGFTQWKISYARWSKDWSEIPNKVFYLSCQQESHTENTFQHNDLYNNFILFMHIKFHRLKICNHSYFIQFVCFSLISSWFFFIFNTLFNFIFWKYFNQKKKPHQILVHCTTVLKKPIVLILRMKAKIKEKIVNKRTISTIDMSIFLQAQISVFHYNK